MRRSNPTTLLTLGAVSVLILRGDACSPKVGDTDGAGELVCDASAYGVKLQIPVEGCKRLGDVCTYGAQHELYPFASGRTGELSNMPSDSILTRSKRNGLNGEYVWELCATDRAVPGGTAKFDVKVTDGAASRTLQIGLEFTAKVDSLLVDLVAKPATLSLGDDLYLEATVLNPKNDSRDLTMQWEGYNLSTGELDASIVEGSKYIPSDNAPEDLRVQNIANAKPARAGLYRYVSRLSKPDGNTEKREINVSVSNGVEAKIDGMSGVNVQVGRPVELTSVSRSADSGDPIVAYKWDVEKGGEAMAPVPAAGDVEWVSIYISRAWHSMYTGSDVHLSLSTTTSEMPAMPSDLSKGLYRARLTVRTQSGLEASALQPFQVCYIDGSQNCSPH